MRITFAGVFFCLFWVEKYSLEDDKISVLGLGYGMDWDCGSAQSILRSFTNPMAQTHDSWLITFPPNLGNFAIIRQESPRARVEMYLTPASALALGPTIPQCKPSGIPPPGTLLARTPIIVGIFLVHAVTQSYRKCFLAMTRNWCHNKLRAVADTTAAIRAQHQLYIPRPRLTHSSWNNFIYCQKCASAAVVVFMSNISQTSMIAILALYWKMAHTINCMLCPHSTRQNDANTHICIGKVIHDWWLGGKLRDHHQQQLKWRSAQYFIHWYLVLTFILCRFKDFVHLSCEQTLHILLHSVLSLFYFINWWRWRRRQRRS